MSEVPAHVERMLNEKDELDNRLTKLRQFMETNPVFHGLALEDQELMQQQANAMVAYSTTLALRIDRATR